MQTHGNLAGAIVEKETMAQKPLANATTDSREFAYQKTSTSIAPSLTYYRMRCFTPTFPTQKKKSLNNSERIWLMLKGNWPTASLPDMEDDSEWDEEEEIYK